MVVYIVFNTTAADLVGLSLKTRQDGVTPALWKFNLRNDCSKFLAYGHFYKFITS